MQDPWGPKGARAYLKWQESYGHAVSSEAVRLLTTQLPTGKNRIMDVGCGVGHPAVLIKEKYPLAHVTGTDSSPHMLEVAKEYTASKNLTDIEYNVCDAQDLSAYGTASFDGLTSVAALFTLPDPLKACKEIKRVLKPGAPAIIHTWGDAEKTEFATSMFSTMMQLLDPSGTGPSPGMPLSNPEQFEKLFHDSGFSKIEIRTFSAPISLSRQDIVGAKDHPGMQMMVGGLVGRGKVASPEEGWTLYRDTWLKNLSEQGYMKGDKATWPTNVGMYAVLTA